MSTYDGFAVSHTIPDLAAQMSKLSKDIDNALVDLERSLKPMTDSWLGQGATNYQNLQARWHGMTSSMEARFSKGQLTLNQSYDAYQNLDKGLGAKFQL
ncbi:WXG100 family type VII secretion target [Amycolatopsis japonica]|uniref:WXG100 family type VII secretion target n=1 Tax=Amycolatopsis japonica TaxID=208439 RepID=UPI00332DA745